MRHARMDVVIADASMLRDEGAVRGRSLCRSFASSDGVKRCYIFGALRTHTTGKQDVSKKTEQNETAQSNIGKER